MEADFHAPDSVEEAVRLLDDDAFVLAGGTQLVPRLRDGRAIARRLVWLGRVPSLGAVTPAPDGGVVVGAAATLAAIARSPLLVGGLACLVEAAAPVGNPRVRARATVGGGVVHADPRQDVPAALVALGTRVRLQGAGGVREVPLEAFHLDDDGVDVRPGELVTALVIPAPGPSASSHLRFTPGSRHDYPTVAVSAVVGTSADGSVTRVMLGLAGAASTTLAVDVTDAVRALDVAALEGRRVGTPGAHRAVDELDEVFEHIVRSSNPTDDRHGSPEYKRDMTRVWARRALLRALSRRVDATETRIG